MISLQLKFNYYTNFISITIVIIILIIKKSNEIISWYDDDECKTKKK